MTPLAYHQQFHRTSSSIQHRHSADLHPEVPAHTRYFKPKGTTLRALAEFQVSSANSHPAWTADLQGTCTHATSSFRGRNNRRAVFQHPPDGTNPVLTLRVVLPVKIPKRTVGMAELFRKCSTKGKFNCAPLPRTRNSFEHNLCLVLLGRLEEMICVTPVLLPVQRIRCREEIVDGNVLEL